MSCRLFGRNQFQNVKRKEEDRVTRDGSINRFHCFELADHRAYPLYIRMIQSCAEFGMIGLLTLGVIHCQYSLISLLVPVVVALNSSYPSSVILWPIWAPNQASWCICVSLYVLYAYAFALAFSYPKQLSAPQIGTETSAWPSQLKRVKNTVKQNMKASSTSRHHSARVVKGYTFKAHWPCFHVAFCLCLFHSLSLSNPNKCKCTQR